MSKQIIKTAFAPVEFPPTPANEKCADVDIVETLIVDTFEQDDEGNIRPITKQVITGKKNRKEYIESFSDDVGLTNILEKIGQGAIAEDKYSILNSERVGSINDLRGFQEVNNMADIQALADKAYATFNNLDPDLKKGMSFSEFCSKFNNKDLEDYVAKKTAPAPASKEEKK